MVRKPVVDPLSELCKCNIVIGGGVMNISSRSKSKGLIHLTLLLIFVMGCGFETQVNGGIDATEIPALPTVSIPTATKSPIDGSEVFYYNLPQATLTEQTGLFASPNRAEWIVQAEIPVGDIVYVMGKNATGSHLRVVWRTGVGWVPVSFTNYNADREKMDSLPVFKREPPSCAEPLVTQFNLNNEWSNTGDQKQRIAVVVDLFRSKYGDFPTSYLALTVNGKGVDSSKRQIVERGQFTLKDVVFTLPNYVYPGDKIGYLLDTSSVEPLAFMATIFSVPENCVWDTN